MRRPRRRVAILLAVAVLVLAADIISKVIVVARLSGRPPVHLVGSLLELTETRNGGAAFSLGGPSVTVLFTAIAVAVIVFIIRAARRIYSLPWAIALGLLLGGALGNLTDRVFRSPGPLRGWVVDWIQLPHWPVFNLADSSIVCGGILMVLISMRGLGIDGARHAPERPAPQPGPAAERAEAEPPAADRPAADRQVAEHPAGDRSQHPGGAG